MPRIQITETGKKPQPYKIKLERETIKIGRASNNDIILTDPSTSSAHCIIRRVEGGFILEDNKSTNGVKLDDQRFSKIDLNQDTEFLLGDVEVEFKFTDEEYDVLAEEDDFTTEQKPMLPPTGDAKKKNDEANRKRREAANEDITLEEDDDEKSEKSPSKKPSSSRASRMMEVERDEDDEAKKERPRQERSIPRRAERLASAKKPNPLVTVLFIVLCIVAFVGGLSIKHYKENKTFFISDILGGEKAAPTEDPADK